MIELDAALPRCPLYQIMELFDVIAANSGRLDMLV